MATFKLYWSPEGKQIATVTADDSRSAIRKAPKPYRKYLGEIYAKRVIRTVIARIYQIETIADGGTIEIVVTSTINGSWIDTWSHGAWHDTGRLPDDIRAIALEDLHEVKPS